MNHYILYWCFFNFYLIWNTPQFCKKWLNALSCSQRQQTSYYGLSKGGQSSVKRSIRDVHLFPLIFDFLNFSDHSHNFSAHTQLNLPKNWQLGQELIILIPAFPCRVHCNCAISGKIFFKSEWQADLNMGKVFFEVITCFKTFTSISSAQGCLEFLVDKTTHAKAS